MNECIRAQVQEFEEEMVEDEDLFREELAEKLRSTDTKDPVAIVKAMVEHKPQVRDNSIASIFRHTS